MAFRVYHFAAARRNGAAEQNCPPRAIVYVSIGEGGHEIYARVYAFDLKWSLPCTAKRRDFSGRLRARPRLRQMGVAAAITAPPGTSGLLSLSG